MLDNLGFYAGVQKERERERKHRKIGFGVECHHVLSKFDTLTRFN